jgi:glutathione S-transferase
MVFFCGDVQIMTEYKLLIADPSYSSWSLRGWLCFAAFGIPVSVSVTRLYTDNFLTDVTAFSRHARTVPVASANDGSQFTDSLTIAEELAHRHPEACLLPSGPATTRDGKSPDGRDA